MKWQTIETAPKDGRRVLLYIQEVDFIVVGFFGLSARDYEGGEKWREGWSHEEIEPSHWAELMLPRELSCQES